MKLHWKILIGMGAGVLVGLLVNEDFVIGGPVGRVLGFFSFLRLWAILLVRPVLDPVGSFLRSASLSS